MHIFINWNVLRPESSEQKELFLSLPTLSASMIKKNFFFFLVWSSNHNPRGNSWGSGRGENNLYIWILQKPRHHKRILERVFHSGFFSPIFLFMCSSVFPLLQREHQPKRWTSWLSWFIKRSKCDQNIIFFLPRRYSRSFDFLNYTHHSGKVIV